MGNLEKSTRAAVMLMIAVLVLRGLVPAGHMAGFDAEEGFVVTLCGDQQGQQLRLDPSTGAYGDLESGSKNAPAGDICPFAVAGDLAGPPLPFIVHAPAWSGQSRIRPPLQYALAAVAHLAPPARAPPHAA